MLGDNFILNLYGKWVAAGENTNAKTEDQRNRLSYVPALLAFYIRVLGTIGIWNGG